MRAPRVAWRDRRSRLCHLALRESRHLPANVTGSVCAPLTPALGFIGAAFGRWHDSEPRDALGGVPRALADEQRGELGAAARANPGWHPALAKARYEAIAARSVGAAARS